MIKDEKQYNLTLVKLLEFENYLDTYRVNKNLPDFLHKGIIDSLNSTIENLKKEIKEYENNA